MTQLSLLRPATPDLQHRLKRLSRLEPEYGLMLSNHLPMALAALDAMGASAQRLDLFTADYRRTHGLRETAPADEPRKPVARDWAALLGSFDDPQGLLRAALARLLAEQGRLALLNHTLPLLLESPGAAAFHGLIRSAHALESGVDEELLEALAYWGRRWLPLPAAPAAIDSLDGADAASAWLDKLDQARVRDEASWHSDARLISQRMLGASRLRAYQDWARALPPVSAAAEADWLAQLARASAQRYLRSGHFTVLHMVTGLRAAAVLCEAGPPLGAAMQQRLLEALAAASLSAGLPLAVPDCASVAQEDKADDWPELMALACTADNDHTIKLIHALAWWQERRPDPLWGHCARRALGGLSA
jgi:hypothetical protein